MRRQIVVLGPLPPPYGGVSLHIVRFLQLLESEGVNARALAYTGTTAGGRIGKARQATRMLARIYAAELLGHPAVIHVHYGGLGYFLALAPLLTASRSRKVVTFHSVRVLQDLKAQSLPVRQWALRLLADFELFVAVRAEIGDALRALGLNKPRITVMPAFLPPAAVEQGLERLPAAVARDLQQGQTAGRLLVCCAAYYLGPGYGHDDIYGVETLLHALSVLEGRGLPEMDLWVLVSNAPQTVAQREAEAVVRASASRLARVRLHLHYGLPLLPVMSRCAGFLRPSREDGDSVAIREALALGVPVLASGVVTRPAGTQTYQSARDLEEALSRFLSGLVPVPPGSVRDIADGGGDRYRAFVSEVLGDTTAR